MQALPAALPAALLAALLGSADCTRCLRAPPRAAPRPLLLSSHPFLSLLGHALHLDRRKARSHACSTPPHRPPQRRRRPPGRAASFARAPERRPPFCLLHMRRSRRSRRAARALTRARPRLATFSYRCSCPGPLRLAPLGTPLWPCFAHSLYVYIRCDPGDQVGFAPWRCSRPPGSCLHPHSRRLAQLPPLTLWVSACAPPAAVCLRACIGLRGAGGPNQRHPELYVLQAPARCHALLVPHGQHFFLFRLVASCCWWGLNSNPQHARVCLRRPL